MTTTPPKRARTISEWVRDSHEQAKGKGWHDGPKRDFGTLIALMHSELSEALEEARNGHPMNETYTTDAHPGKPEGVGIEFADVLIRIFDACGLLGIDLEAAMERKFAYNQTRPQRHGGKQF